MIIHHKKAVEDVRMPGNYDLIDSYVSLIKPLYGYAATEKFLYAISASLIAFSKLPTPDDKCCVCIACNKNTINQNG